jgi:hypothetical protein
MCQVIALLKISKYYSADNFATAVETVGSDVVTTVSFTRSFVHGKSGGSQCIMRATHATFGTGWFILLYGHGPYSSITFL